MKCPNCGFDSNEKYCRMCGTKIPEQSMPQNFNSYGDNKDVSENAVSGDFEGSQHDVSMGFETGNNGYSSNPYTYNNPADPFSAQPNYNPAQSEFPPMPPNTGMPQQNIPQQNIPQNAMPVPNVQYNTGYPKKKNHKALTVVICSLVAAVIVAGAGISVYSALSYNKSFSDIIESGIIGEEDNAYSDPEVYEDAYDIYEESEVYNVGDSVSFENLKITLKEAKNTGPSSFGYGNKNLWEFTFELENTGDYDIEVYSNADFEFKLDDNSVTYYDNVLDESIYNDEGNIEVEAGKKAEYIVGYNIDKDVKSFEFELSMSDITEQFDCISHFAVNPSNDKK